VANSDAIVDLDNDFFDQQPDDPPPFKHAKILGGLLETTEKGLQRLFELRGALGDERLPARPFQFLFGGLLATA
jgi:hypothetical protein